MKVKLAAALACVALLIALTASLPAPFAFEKALIIAAGNSRNDFTLSIAYALHYIGKYGVIVVAILAVIYLARREWQTAVFIVLSTSLAAASTAILKIIIARPRPDILDHLVLQHDASFPSGHSTFAAALALALMLRYRHLAVWILGIFFMLAMGWSRLMLGVHYPLDVLAGYCVGMFCTLVFKMIFPKFSRIVGRPFMADGK